VAHAAVVEIIDALRADEFDDLLLVLSGQLVGGGVGVVEMDDDL